MIFFLALALVLFLIRPLPLARPFLPVLSCGLTILALPHRNWHCNLLSTFWFIFVFLFLFVQLGLPILTSLGSIPVWMKWVERLKNKVEMSALSGNIHGESG